ncbi:MAG: after-VIT domain-containing protein, partial [Planktothrix sp.]
EVRVDPNGTRQTVEVPLELPQGVSYDGIFGTPEISQLQSAKPMSLGRTRSASGLNNYGSQSSPEIAPPPSILSGSDLLPTRLSTSKNTASTITVIQLTGISDRTLINDLNLYLQGLNLADEINGKVTFEMIIDQGNVQRAIFDDVDSNLNVENNLKQAIIIDQIRRSLLTWQPSNPVTGKLKITLELKATPSPTP